MQLAKFLLPLLPLAGVSLASHQQRAHGWQNCSSTGIEPHEFLAGLTGLIYISRTLWMETLHVHKDTAAKTVDEIIFDLIVGSETIFMQTLLLEDTSPFDHAPFYETLFASFQTWGDMTNAFFQTLGEFSQTFLEAAPNLGPAIASNLTVFEETATNFCFELLDAVPSLAPNVTEVLTGLVSSFEDTIYNFNSKASGRR